MRIVVEMDVPERYRARVVDLDNDGDHTALREVADNIGYGSVTVDHDGTDFKAWQRLAREANRAACEAMAERDAAGTAIERVKVLAEKWRYKGEFGWGPWQSGEGPDPEGHVLDFVAAEIRQALEAT